MLVSIFLVSVIITLKVLVRSTKKNTLTPIKVRSTYRNF